MNRELKDIFLIARHDYRDAFRSRRLIVWLLLYLCVAVGGTFIFTQVLRFAEKEIAGAISIETSDKAGSVVSSLQKSDTFREIISGVVEDDDLVTQLLTLSPLVLFYAWFSFTFMPLLVILLCSDTIARDVQTRYVRFNLFRTSRAAYTIGKSLSAATILLAALTISSLAVMLIGVFRIHNFEFFNALPYMMLFVVKCWIYSLSFLGVALLASQVRKSPFRAQILAMLIYFFLVIISPIAESQTGPGFARLWELGILISPSSHMTDLWRPNFMANLKATAFCLGLGIFYFSLGFSAFSRKDL
ncbi:ABC transporter permease subunit [bacterium]|nr:ABC transporter permease subunit [bacterium]